MMALNIAMKPEHYCRRCLTETAMVADTGGRTRQPGDWVFCLTCNMPHIFEGDSVRLATVDDMQALSKEKRIDTVLFAQQLQDPEFLLAAGIVSRKPAKST